jgi:hypothetical protein
VALVDVSKAVVRIVGVVVNGSVVVARDELLKVVLRIVVVGSVLVVVAVVVVGLVVTRVVVVGRRVVLKLLVDVEARVVRNVVGLAVVVRVVAEA